MVRRQAPPQLGAAYGIARRTDLRSIDKLSLRDTLDTLAGCTAWPGWPKYAPGRNATSTLGQREKNKRSNGAGVAAELRSVYRPARGQRVARADHEARGRAPCAAATVTVCGAVACGPIVAQGRGAAKSESRAKFRFGFPGSPPTRRSRRGRGRRRGHRRSRPPSRTSGRLAHSRWTASALLAFCETAEGSRS